MSRATEATSGTIMMPRMIPAVRTPTPDGTLEWKIVPTIGIPWTRFDTGTCTTCAKSGAKAKRPHIP